MDGEKGRGRFVMGEALERRKKKMCDWREGGRGTRTHSKRKRKVEN